jgi:hypothetical protein
LEVIQVVDAILLLLIPVAYYVGRFTQRRADFKQIMQMMRRERRL